MIRSMTKAVVGLAFLVVAACATGPDYAYKPWGASIAQPDEIYAAWKWGKEIEAGLIDAGRKDEIETIKAHSNEKGWPEKLGAIKERLNHPEIVRQIKGEVIAAFKNGEASVVVMHVPAAQNTHLPEGWRPVEDIYIVARESAISKK